MDRINLSGPPQTAQITYVADKQTNSQLQFHKAPQGSHSFRNLLKQAVTAEPELNISYYQTDYYSIVPVVYIFSKASTCSITKPVSGAPLKMSTQDSNFLGARPLLPFVYFWTV